MNSIFGAIVGIISAVLSVFGLGQHNPSPLPPTEHAPVISSIAPSSGSVGTHITLEGSGFGSPHSILIDDGDELAQNYNEKVDGDSSTTFTLGYVSGIDVCAHRFANTTCDPPVSIISVGLHTIRIKNKNGISNRVNFTVASPSSNVGNTPAAVPGMSTYTDTDFGFSFWYPSGKAVKVGAIATDATWMYGTDTKILKTINGPEFTIDEVYSPDTSILSSVDAGCCGSPGSKYFFDVQAHTWMLFSDGAPAGKGAGTFAADTSKNTMGGLHIFQGYTRFGNKVIIPLTAHNFLVIYSACNDATDYSCDWNSTSPQSGLNRFKASVQTIIATDPSVATPVSAAEQIKTIQAEKDTYAGQ